MQDPSKNDLDLGIFGKRVNDLYVFDHQDIQDNLSFSLSFSVFKFGNLDYVSLSSVKLWHNIIGHVPINKLRQILLDSYHVIDHYLDSCFTCSQAKQTKLPFPKSSCVSLNSFDLVHIDIWGPYKHSTFDGHKYFLTIVDDCSRYT